jgi:hypothetical protein
MNISKYMDGVFLAALIVLSVTGAARAAVPTLFAPRVQVVVSNEGAMPVVAVTAKRLTAAQKAELAL